jgi:glucose-1-phosphate adenylyltransferase
VQIAAEVEIGYDLEADKKRFDVTENGVIVIPKGATVG